MKHQKTTLLIVDDDDDARFLLKRAIQSFSSNYKIQALGGGNEAVEYLEGEGKFQDRSRFPFPSYIITDLHMSEGDGFTILDYIKQHPALSVIPVVMLSSSDDTDDIRTAYILGASSYIVKPPTQQALRELLRTIHEYWKHCEVPEIDEDGYAVFTSSVGKSGERFTKPTRQSREPA